MCIYIYNTKLPVAGGFRYLNLCPENRYLEKIDFQKGRQEIRSSWDPSKIGWMRAVESAEKAVEIAWVSFLALVASLAREKAAARQVR